MFSCSRNAQVAFAEKQQLKIVSFQNYKRKDLIHTILNWALPSFQGIHFKSRLHSLLDMTEVEFQEIPFNLIYEMFLNGNLG